MYNPNRVKKAWEEAKREGLLEDQEMEREGWKTILCVLPAFLLLAYLIAHFVVYLWS